MNRGIFDRDISQTIQIYIIKNSQLDMTYDYKSIKFFLIESKTANGHEFHQLKKSNENFKQNACN